MEAMRGVVGVVVRVLSQSRRRRRGGMLGGRGRGLFLRGVRRGILHRKKWHWLGRWGDGGLWVGWY